MDVVAQPAETGDICFCGTSLGGDAAETTETVGQFFWPGRSFPRMLWHAYAARTLWVLDRMDCSFSGAVHVVHYFVILLFCFLEDIYIQVMERKLHLVHPRSRTDSPLCASSGALLEDLLVAAPS